MRKQNKFLASCFVGLAALGFPSALPAQTYSEAMAAYQAFQSAGASGDEARTLDALYSCYKSLEAALRNAQPGNTEYSEMKNLMREIWPSLQRGAAYNSSHGNKGNAVLFAQAFIDVPLMPCFAGETFPTDDYFPTMAYFAASNTYNMKDYERAVKYFRVYLDTRDPKNRQSVFEHAAKAYMNLKNYDMAMNVLNEATDAFPDNFNMLSMAINNCIDRNDQPNLQRFVDKAIKLRPNDETLLNIQGKLYEDTQDFQKALNVYNKLKQSKPNNMTIMKHIAVNYYNLGVLNFNNAAMEQSSGNAKKFSRQAKEYFQAAASVLEDIVANEPASAKYLTALGTAYSCMGDNGKLEKTNTRLASVGGAPVSDKVVPVLMDYNSQGATGTFTASANTGTYTAGGSSYSATPAPASSPAASAAEAPQYSAYAKDYVETRLKKWLSKDSYETVSEYQARVNDQTRKAETDRLLKEAEKSYIDTYTKGIRFTDMTLKPYDADHGAFLVESRYGELIVPVPRENNEAKVFESGWSGMQFKNPEFYISDDKLMLSGLTFVTPNGRSYRFDGDKNLNYVETRVDVNFDGLSGDLFAANNAGNKGSKVTRQTISQGTVQSDVDKNIPETKDINDKTFAIIISNENYDMVAGVPMALNDGETFSKYCNKTLGLPESNIRLYKDASFGVMLRAMRDIRDIAEAFNGDLNVIFYYAGHGIPDEATKDAFLLPVDADGKQTDGCYSLNRLYDELQALNARSTVVFLDACFSGAKRDGGMLASARGVALKPKKTAPKGNMVVMSAASGDETAFPYEEKGHGLFTYFLLKKLQESKGNVNLGDLSDYVSDNVKKQSVIVNRKVQTPSVTPSPAVLDTWKNLKLKK